MLNQDTKRRIDSARDILVGKVPDPKAQVEQITNALIYKFMDDMDNESEELGGKARFFVGDYEKYAWSKLLDVRLGGIERLNLYTEALIKLQQNPNLPQLFRDILKDAFLPYRDPETLNLFLKEINSFTYDHSEKLGDAFEYLLSIMGAQGDAGQFRTPRHIIDFIVEVVDPKKEDTILDPACGTAGFLISAYKHILRENGVRVPGDQLTPDQRTKLTNHFIGYDISPDMVRLSLVNMYLHSFPNPRIYEYDTLTSEERWNEANDVVMANPPFMSPKGGIRPHKRFSIQANRSEVLFVDYIAEHLTIHGRAGVIVPEGIIFSTGGAYKALRKMLIEKCVWAVVSLPAGIFLPYSGVKTSILLMDKTLAKKAENILFVKVTNDGFDLGAQRRAIDKNDLTQALAILQQYKQTLQKGEDPSGILNSSEVANMAVIAKKALIAKNGDYNLSGERYRKIAQLRKLNYDIVELADVCVVNAETIDPLELYGENEFYYLDISSVGNGTGSVSFKTKIKGVDAPSRARRKIRPADVLLSTVRPNLKAFAYLSELPENSIASTGFAVLTPTERIISKYVYYMLFSAPLQAQMISRMEKGAYPSINQKDVEQLTFPLPSLEIQQEIVAELDGYQKIIDGARQVSEIWKPNIKIDPNWVVYKLIDITNFIDYRGITPQKTSSGIPLITAKNVKKGYINEYPKEYIAIDNYEPWMRRGIPKKGDVLITTEAPLGNVAQIETDSKFAIAQRIIALQPNEEIILPSFLMYILLVDEIQNKLVTNSTGSTVSGIRSSDLREIEIPLPSLDTQKQIITQIEEERKRVQATKELVEIFEQKIKDKIAEVWGEETTAPLQSDLVAVS